MTSMTSDNHFISFCQVRQHLASELPNLSMKPKKQLQSPLKTWTSVWVQIQVLEIENEAELIDEIDMKVTQNFESMTICEDRIKRQWKHQSGVGSWADHKCKPIDAARFRFFVCVLNAIGSIIIMLTALWWVGMLTQGCIVQQSCCVYAYLVLVSRWEERHKLVLWLEKHVFPHSSSRYIYIHSCSQEACVWCTPGAGHARNFSVDVEWKQYQNKLGHDLRTDFDCRSQDRLNSTPWIKRRALWDEPWKAHSRCGRTPICQKPAATFKLFCFVQVAPEMYPGCMGT